MIAYISAGNALQTLAVTYLASVVLLMSASYLCYTVVETIENGGNP